MHLQSASAPPLHRLLGLLQVEGEGVRLSGQKLTDSSGYSCCGPWPQAASNGSTGSSIDRSLSTNVSFSRLPGQNFDNQRLCHKMLLFAASLRKISANRSFYRALKGLWDTFPETQRLMRSSMGMGGRKLARQVERPPGVRSPPVAPVSVHSLDLGHGPIAGHPKEV